MYINVDSFRGTSKAELLRRATTPAQAGAAHDVHVGHPVVGGADVARGKLQGILPV